MKKAKNINERPMVIVSTHVTKWRIRYDAYNNEFYLTKTDENRHELDCDDEFEQFVNALEIAGKTHEEAVNIASAKRSRYISTKLKEETATTGIFKCFGGRWGYDPFVHSGKFVSSYEYWKNPEPCDYNNVQEVFNALAHSHIDFQTQQYIYLKRILYTYTNSQTLEATKDINVAKQWFKDQNPLWINHANHQQVGIWIDGKNDHVEVSFWYAEHTDRKQKAAKWINPEQTGFWLYPDGTMSHFWKGKVFDQNRKYEENRVTYHSFDQRFKELMVSQYSLIDLRSPDSSERTSERYELCEESRKLLKKAGFPDTYWIWRNNSTRPLTRTIDLLNFILFKQKGQIAKKHEAMHNMLQNKPFNIEDESSFVTVFKDGLLVRIPDVIVVYRDVRGNIAYERWGLAEPKVENMIIVEANRVWIKNNGKQISCAKSIHGGSEWTSCSMNDINVGDYDRKLNYNDQYWTPAENALYKKLVKKCSDVRRKIRDTIQEQLPVLQYYTEQLKNLDWTGLFTFLSCFQKAPSLVDTLVKTGQLGLLRSGYDHTTFDLSQIFNLFAMNSSEYRERKGRKLWKNLGVTKEQYYYALEFPTTAKQIFAELRTNLLPVPITPGIPMYDPKKKYVGGEIVQRGYSVYKRLEEFKCEPEDNDSTFDAAWAVVNYPHDERGTLLYEIPMKFIKIMHDLLNGHDRIYDLRQLIVRQKLTLTELEILAQRGLNFQLLSDYWNILNQMHYYTRDIGDGWDRLPKTPELLRQLHDEANIRLNLAREEYQAARAREEQIREQNNTAKYKKYLKTLAKFAMEDEQYTVVIPQKLSEIVDEGASLSHCVGSYTGRVANGETFVFFLREKTDVKRSFVTFNILPVRDGRTTGNRVHKNSTHKWCMDQAFAKCDTKPCKSAIEFIKAWTEKNDVDFSTIMSACI